MTSTCPTCKKVVDSLVLAHNSWICRECKEKEYVRCAKCGWYNIPKKLNIKYCEECWEEGTREDLEHEIATLKEYIKKLEVNKMKYTLKDERDFDVMSTIADSYEEALQVFFDRLKLAEVDTVEELKKLFEETDYSIVKEIRL